MRFFSFFLAVAAAGPVVRGSRDLPHNYGILDICFETDDGQVYCGAPQDQQTTSPTMTSPVASSAISVPSYKSDDGSTSLQSFSRQSHSHNPYRSHSHHPHTTSTETSSIVSSTSLPSAPMSYTGQSAASSSQNTPYSQPSPAAVLPLDNSTFANDKDKKWTLDIVPGTNEKQKIGQGAIYSSSIHRLGWDKGRTSQIDGKIFWNFGDVLSVDGVDKGGAAGFSMGAAFYANKKNVLEVDMKGIDNVTDWTFAKPWTGQPNPDPVPGPEWMGYGIDTSNTAQVAPGIGIAFGWEIFRNMITYEDKGAACYIVTLGDKTPIATRTGGLITGPDAIAIGSMTIFNPNIKNSPHADGYLYMYSTGAGAWDSVIVGRVLIADAFDHTKYQFLKASGEWDAPGVIPNRGDSSYGMQGTPVSNSQGSIFFNDHLQKYQMFVGTMGHFAGFYTADTPTGPWGPYYQIMESTDALRYGVNVHPELTPDSTGKEVYVSWGTNVVITLYKFTMNY